MVTTHIPLFIVLMSGNGSQDYLLHHLPRNWGEADQPIVCWIPLLLFLKIGVTFAFSWPSGASSSHHGLSQIIRSGLTMTPASSLSSHGRIPLCPMDLHMYSLYQCSLTWSLSTICKSSLLQTFRLVSGLSWLSAQLLVIPRFLSKATSGRQSKGGHLPGALGYCAKGHKWAVSAAWPETEHGIATMGGLSLEQPWIQVTPGATCQDTHLKSSPWDLEGVLQTNDSCCTGEAEISLTRSSLFRPLALANCKA